MQTTSVHERVCGDHNYVQFVFILNQICLNFSTQMELQAVADDGGGKTQ